MKLKRFTVPLYKWRVVIIQIESKKDVNLLRKKLNNYGAQQEDIEELCNGTEYESRNGGMHMAGNKISVVVFYPFTNDKEKTNSVGHEKRHIEDEIIEKFNINCIESNALLAGFLSEKFHTLI